MGQPIPAGAGRDRLSDLDDEVIGHILSFLDAKEAARAAALSSRWRDVFASVHTISLELPERPPHDDHTDLMYHLRILRPFVAGVTAALFARDRRSAPAAAAVPLRALRVCMEGSVDYSTVGLWVSCALRHAAPDLEVDLRLGRKPVCWGIDRKPVHRFQPAVSPYRNHGMLLNIDPVDPSLSADANDDDDAASSDDDMPSGFGNRLYIRELPRPLFSCATLRTLRLVSCCLSTPEAVSLPSLEVLHLTNVREEEEHVQRLISACPLLADLMVEACGTVTALRLVDNTRLRRLAIRFCDNLATVDMDPSQLLSLEYLGAIPDNSFLAAGSGGGGFPAIASCKIDTADAALPDKPEDLVKLSSFLQLFVATKHLHLCSTRMGSCFMNLPEFPSLRHLELNGRVLQGDDPAFAIDVTSTILSQAPNLELLTLVFQAPPQDQEWQQRNGPYRGRIIEGELVDVHLLQYDKYDTIDYALMVNTPVPHCLVNQVSKIELVHYQGGRAQRTLAKFLLGNAPALKMLYCGFAAGPEWTQMQLMREIEGWVINETARKEFR